MTREEFLQIAAEHQLAHIGEMLFSTTVPGIRVFERALRDALPDDKTFIGGMPSPMPRHWPDHAHTPLTFVGQVDTSSLPPGVSPVSLPSGILQFFVPSMSETTGYEPSLDRGRVLFVTAGATQSDNDGERHSARQQQVKPVGATPRSSLLSSLLRLFRPAPRAEPDGSTAFPHKPFPKRSFDWEVFPSLYAAAPDRDALWLPEKAQQFDFNYDADEDNYFEFRRSVIEHHQDILQVQMFGFADALQEDMEPLVDVASGHRSLNEFREWILLFVLNSSCGGLAPEAVSYYFWIHHEDLADARFETVWLCVQQD